MIAPTCSRHRLGNAFIRIPVLSILFFYTMAGFSQEREYNATAMELIDVFCPLDSLKELFLPDAKTEIQEGINREGVLPHWNTDLNSVEVEPDNNVQERYNEWAGFIDNFAYNDFFLKVIEGEFTHDELKILNKYLITGSGKKLLRLYMEIFPEIEESDMALLNLDPSDEITINYFAGDLDDFIAFRQTELGQKFLFYSTKNYIRIPKILVLCHAVMRSVLRGAIERYNLERFQNESIRETRSVIVANTSITNGAVLTQNQLALREYPNDDIPAGSLFLNSLDIIVNGRVSSDIKAGTPVIMEHIESTLVVVPRDSVPAGTVITRSKFAVRNIASANVSPGYLVPEEFADIEFYILADAIEQGSPIPKSSILSQQDSCRLARGLKSINGTDLLDVSITNSREKNVRLNWINYDGMEVDYGEIKANETKNMQTYITHPWVIRSLDGECLALFNFIENTQVTVK